MSYQVPLRVSDIKGNRVLAEVEYSRGVAHVTVPYIPEVAEDNPEFSRNGVIRYAVNRVDYQQSIEKLTSYLEGLFLKGMSHDSSGSSVESTHNSGGDKESDPSGKVESAEGRSDTSVRTRSRRRVSSESDWGRDDDTDLAESSSSED